MNYVNVASIIPWNLVLSTQFRNQSLKFIEEKNLTFTLHIIISRQKELKLHCLDTILGSFER